MLTLPSIFDFYYLFIYFGIERELSPTTIKKTRPRLRFPPTLCLFSGWHINIVDVRSHVCDARPLVQVKKTDLENVTCRMTRQETFVSDADAFFCFVFFRLGQ